MIPDRRELFPTEQEKTDPQFLAVNLLNRDLAALRLHELTILDRLRNIFGKTEFITYDLTSGGVDPKKIADLLNEKGKLDKATSSVVSRRWKEFPVLNPFALSSQTDSHILSLMKRGYGFWPVYDGLKLEDVDLNGLSLEPNQKGLLRVSEPPSETSSSGFWFDPKRLVANQRPIEQNYLPSLTEVLFVLGLYQKQEGTYPNSYSSWLQTSSRLSLELGETVQAACDGLNARRVLLEACIDGHQTPDLIRKYLAVPGNFAQKDDHGEFKREQGVFTLRRFGNESFRQYGDEISSVELDSSKKLVQTSESGRTYYKVTSFGTTEGQYEKSTVLREIGLKNEQVQRFFQNQVDVPVCLKVHPRSGVEFGVSLDPLDEALYWKIVGGNLTFNFQRFISPDLNKRVAWLPLIRNAKWPLIYPDHFGRLINI